MLRRLRAAFPLELLHILEASLIGLFFVQALRYLVGAIYAGTGSASLVAVLGLENVPAGAAGAVTPTDFSTQLSFLVYMLALPLISLVIGRVRWLILPAALLVVIARALMFAGTPLFTPLTGGAAVMGGGLLYLALLVRHRAQMLPYLFVLALGADQVFRAVGDTLDPSWSMAYLPVQYGLSIFTVLLVLLNLLVSDPTLRRRRAERGEPALSPDQGLMTFSGGISFGAMLFLQFSLLALPNAIAGRAAFDYTALVPFTLAATLLPLIPFVRERARNLIGIFDSGVRGWLWMLLVTLLIVFGERMQPVLDDLGLDSRSAGAIAAGALVLAQLCVSLMWWWLVRPQAERERSFGGLWLIVGMLIFGGLVFCDVFTYEYAYVTPAAPDMDILNRTVLPLLRGFRGMGLAIALLAVLLAALPMVQMSRRIPWQGSKRRLASLVAILIVLGSSIGAALAARPPIITAVRGVDTIRVGSYNINAGFSEFYAYDLEALARTIGSSGASVMLLQEVDAGRMTSFGVDQGLWLARRLSMDLRFFPTNEGLQGLATLSRVEIVFSDGNLLTSRGNQTGVQRVQVRPDAGVVTLYNTWLGLLTAGIDGTINSADEQDQQRQLNEIFALMALHHPDNIYGRTILGGTFNNVPDSPLIQQVRQFGFRDPLAGLPLELSATLRRSGLPPAQFDYLWILNLQEQSGQALAGGTSDRAPIVVEVFLRR